MGPVTLCAWCIFVCLHQQVPRCLGHCCLTAHQRWDKQSSWPAKCQDLQNQRSAGSKVWKQTHNRKLYFRRLHLFDVLSDQIIFPHSHTYLVIYVVVYPHFASKVTLTYMKNWQLSQLFHTVLNKFIRLPPNARFAAALKYQHHLYASVMVNPTFFYTFVFSCYYIGLSSKFVAHFIYSVCTCQSFVI